MVRYLTNFMGPISTKWYEDNNIPFILSSHWSTIFGKEVSHKHYEQWCGGRIDVYGTDEMFNPEIALPVMKAKSWNRFTKWLDNYKTKEIQTLDNILKAYYDEGNPKIIWWEKEDD